MCVSRRGTATRRGRNLSREFQAQPVDVLLVGGVVCLRNLGLAVSFLATLVAVLWLLNGLSKLLGAVAATGPARGWLLGVGSLSTLVGLVFLFWPELSLATLVVITGVTGVVLGIAELCFAYAARKLTMRA